MGQDEALRFRSTVVVLVLEEWEWICCAVFTTYGTVCKKDNLLA